MVSGSGSHRPGPIRVWGGEGGRGLGDLNLVVMAAFWVSFFFFFAEMVDLMKKVAKLDVELTVEERNLLSVGYKNVIGARRAAWRILSSIEQKEESRGNDQNARRNKEFRQKVESELSTICGDIMTIIDEHLIPSATAGESSVFYYKM